MQNNQTFALPEGIFGASDPSFGSHKTRYGVPKFCQKKAVLQNYLTQHNIPFSTTDTKQVLYEKITQKRPH
jgi:hypothetical protein